MSEYFKRRDEQHIEDLRAAIGGAVITRYLGQYPKRDALVGKLLEVRRTRATVEFEGERFSYPATDIMLESAKANRGWAI